MPIVLLPIEGAVAGRDSQARDGSLGYIGITIGRRHWPDFSAPDFSEIDASPSATL